MTKTATREGVVPQGEVGPKQLTPKQLRFVDEYLIDLNASDAARRAGYSLKTAPKIGFENLQKPEVARAIEAKRKELAAKAGITREKILAEMAKLAFSDVRELFDEKGHIRPIHELSDAVAGAISSIEVDVMTLGKPDEDGVVTKVWTKKVKTWDKGKQLENLLKHLGMAEDKPPEAPTGPQQVPNYDLLAAKLAKHVKPEGAQA